MPAGEAQTDEAQAEAAARRRRPRNPPATFSLPADVTAGADVTVQQIVYKGQAIDDADVSARTRQRRAHHQDRLGQAAGRQLGELERRADRAETGSRISPAR